MLLLLFSSSSKCMFQYTHSPLFRCRNMSKKIINKCNMCEADSLQPTAHLYFLHIHRFPGIILFIIVSSARHVHICMCVCVSINSNLLVTGYRPLNDHCIVHCVEPIGPHRRMRLVKVRECVCAPMHARRKNGELSWASFIVFTIQAHTNTNPQVMCALFPTKMTIWYCCEKKERYDTDAHQNSLEHRKSDQCLPHHLCASCFATSTTLERRASGQAFFVVGP